MRFRTITLLALCFILSIGMEAKNYTVKSPDGRLTVTINIDQFTTWAIQKDQQDILLASPIAMQINKNVWLGRQAQVKRTKSKKVRETILPVVARKQKQLNDHYNELVIDFKSNYQLIVRAYDEGAAYRWKTALKGDITVETEEVSFLFKDDYQLWFPEEQSMYTHQERLYEFTRLSAITPDRFGSTGMLVALPEGRKVYISESDLMDYPGMFLKGSEKGFGLEGKFAGVPLETKQVSDRDVKVTKYADYLAQTKGSRAFPWRLVIISDEDKDLVESELVYKLASPLAIESAEWIKPGKVAWDWWNDLNITGVDFEAGVNTPTYKYYIDFASQHGLDYIILDEGWYHLDDVLKIKQEVDLQELLRYGREKNVDLILWVTWKALEDKLDVALTQFEEWGVKGIKVDFMQRDDQWMVNYYERVAKKAAEHHLLVDFHGAYKPAGLRRAFPNVITYEGVYGLEQNKWGKEETPEHNVTLPFIRMVAGPMDFTPGAMINANKESFRPVWSKPMSQGTRCHQLAMYVIYESPLQMLADSPSNYNKEPECMKFLSVVPTTWDESHVLQAQVSDYIAMARQKENVWYLGAMTDWSERDLEIDFSFLGEGQYELTIWEDGINAHRDATDFKTRIVEVNAASKLVFHLAPGGGLAGIIKMK